MAGGGAQSGKRKSNKKAPGHDALRIAEQINFCREQLIGFKTAYEIRGMLAERWDMPARTADDRIKAAREAIRDDVAVIDRQELAATLTDMLHKVAEESIKRGQFNNCIGAMRLIGEIGGINGNNRA